MNKKSAFPKFSSEPPHIWLTEEQRNHIRSAAQLGRDYTKPNERLELAITQTRNQNPSAFLTEKDLPLRQFFNEPMQPIPYQASAIRN